MTNHDEFNQHVREMSCGGDVARRKFLKMWLNTLFHMPQHLDIVNNVKQTLYVHWSQEDKDLTDFIMGEVIEALALDD